MKVAVLLVLTLGVMRLMSWAIGWALRRVFRSSGKLVRVGANLAALMAFAAYLVYDRLPGELLDSSALVFGTVTFSIFAVVDCLWWPWSKQEDRLTS